MNKTSHDWVGKVFHRELYEKLKFYDSTKCYMLNPEFILDYEMHNILLFWGTNGFSYPDQKTRPSDKQEKVNLLNSGHWRPSALDWVNQRKRKYRQVPKPCWRTKKTIERKVSGETNRSWRARNDVQRLGKRDWMSSKSDEEPNASKQQHFLRSARIPETWGDLLSLRL